MVQPNIHAAMLALKDRGEPVDIVTLHHEMKKRPLHGLDVREATRWLVDALPSPPSGNHRIHDAR